MTQEVEHICVVCGWKYDEDKYGKWENLSDDFECPICRSEKDLFEEVQIRDIGRIASVINSVSKIVN